MTTLLVTHPACIDHDPGQFHPERPDRLRAVLAALSADEFKGLERASAPIATDAQLALCHPQSQIEAVMGTIPPQGRQHLDGDTAVSPGSGEAALRAAGAVVAAVDAVCTGKVKNAFCAVRPPGHHAEADQAMGFCLFNNVAVGAVHARKMHGLSRVAVIDFDVHHGNGTQHLFERDPHLFYASSHQWPFYPGTGSEMEKGVGNIVNAPLNAHSGGLEFRDAFTRKILPALDKFAPELVIISAGFDAHEDDPLASLRLHEEDYEWVTAALAEVARTHAGGRLVSALEGGYDLQALASSSAAHVRALMQA